MKKLLAALAALVLLLASCASDAAPLVEETTTTTTTQEPTEATTLFIYSYATAATRSAVEITLPETQTCPCGGDVDGVCEFAEHLAMRPSTAPMNIKYNPSDAFMAQFNTTHTLAFERPDWAQDHRSIVFWTDDPLRDFSYIRLNIHSWDVCWSEIGFPLYAQDTLHTIEEFLPGDAFVVQDWFGIYQYPTAGFTFIDQNGEQRYMYFLQSMMDGRFFISYFENNPPPNN